MTIGDNSWFQSEELELGDALFRLKCRMSLVWQALLQETTMSETLPVGCCFLSYREQMQAVASKIKGLDKVSPMG